MAATIGALMVDIGANVARLQHDLNRAQSTFKRSTTRMKKMAAGLGVAIGASFGVSKMINAGKHSLETADKYAKMSRSIGISVEQLSAFNHVAELSGTSFDTIAKGAGRLARNMKDTRDGTGEAKDTFEELGVSVVTANGQLRDSNAVILDIAEKFKTLPDGPLKTAAAMEIFGRAGEDLIPMLNAGKTGIAEMQAEAHRLGITFDTSTAHAAERVNDQTLRVNRSFGGLVNKVMVRLLPDLENLSNMMFAAAENTGEMDYVARSVSGAMKLAAISAVSTSSAFETVGKAIGGSAAAAMFYIEGDYANANKVLKWTAEDAANSVEKSFNRINKIWAGLPAVSEITKTTVIKHAGEIANTSSTAVGALATSVTKSTSEMQDAVEGWGNGFAGTLAGMVHGSKTSFADILSSFSQMITEMIIKQQIVQPLLGSLGGLFGGGVGPSTFTTSAVGPASYNGNVFNAGRVVPHYNGGIVSQMSAFPMAGGGVGTMAEKGPEAIMPLKRINGKLGVVAEGGGSNKTIIQNHFSIDARGADAGVAERIEQGTRRAVDESLRRVLDDAKRNGPIRQAMR